MINYKENDKFVFSSSCKAVKGAGRSIIIDYQRQKIHFITNEFYELLQLLDRKTISLIHALIDSESQKNFREFLNFMLKNELGFVTSQLENYPKRKDEYEDFVSIKDAIIEIDKNSFNKNSFVETLIQLDSLFCNDIQLRILSDFDEKFVLEVLSDINRTNINYVELHFANASNIKEKTFLKLLENNATLSHIYVYGYGENKVKAHYLEPEKFYPLLIGNVYYVKKEFDNGNCCGSISFENLTFDNLYIHQTHTKFNGCLYKKVTVDKNGNIKNCPSMSKMFGNISSNSLNEIINTKAFRTVWKINKDQIEICKDCEFRYNCSDCRAFLSDDENIKSKPLKCGYDPYTNTWEDWSKNVLKELSQNNVTSE